MYTIGQVSRLLHIPISTLRYYDRQGLFPDMTRQGGARRFSDRELEVLRLVGCLKKSGLEIRDIKQFIDWCAQGPATFAQRKALLEQQKQTVEAEIAHMEKALDMLRYKCWYYEQALAAGTDEALRRLTPDQLPAPIRQSYIHAHQPEEP